MNLSSGAHLGPYEIVADLGAGGMGEVYRAKDTRLDRVVAIKVLPSHLAGDHALQQRFEREAKTISSLNHPNICVIYDVGHQDGLHYLVMEHLEGETLASRLAKGPFSAEQALPLAIQIAGALEAAHSRNVVHRDLKPANIMLTKSGAKLLDFGLARIVKETPNDDHTLTAGLTQPGAILGTFRYMSPEQLEGKEADTRCDLFAFGAVLYEMLAGRRAFDGATQASLISEIMSTEPPAIAPIPTLSGSLYDRVVKICLAKDPDARWQSAHDLKLELSWIGSAVRPPAETSRPSIRQKAIFIMAVALVIVAVLILLDRTRAVSRPFEAVRSSLLPPSGQFFQRGHFSVSPDGTRLAFVAVGADGKYCLWVSNFSSATAQQVSGTDGAVLPFWAPDSRRIGFFADGKLRTVDLGSGAVRIICEAPFGRYGGSWSRSGVIVFAPYISGPLYRVSESGGVAVPSTTILRQSGGQLHTWPFFLPDGKHFLYGVEWTPPDDPQGRGIYVGSLDGTQPKLVSSELSGNVEFAEGHLLYGQDRSLRAQPFDPDRMQFSGPSVSIAEQELQVDAGFSHSEFSVSQNGEIVFQSMTDSVSRLMWFDKGGKEVGQIPETGFGEPRFSPDGRFLAISSDDARNGKLFVRVYDLARGVSTRLSEGPEDESPVWSHNAAKMAFGALDGKLHYLETVAADGSSPPQRLVKADAIVRHLDWSPDGHILFSEFSKGPVIMIYSPVDNKVVPFAEGAEARFSPDGGWIAYIAGVSGIVVQSFPGQSGRIEISRGSGSQPTWSRDGRQIFYIAPDRKLMAVSFDPGSRSAGPPRMVFQTRIVAPNFFSTQYDVSPDGRFLINSVPSNYSSPLTLLTGWTAQLKH